MNELFITVDCYQHESGLLTISTSNSNIILRDFEDLKKLNRDSNRNLSSRGLTTSVGFPATSYKKLVSEGSWTKNCSGWNVCNSASVHKLEHWLMTVAHNNPPLMTQFMDDVSHQLIKDEKKLRLETEVRPRQLQQYFASEKNIVTLLNLVMIDVRNDIQNSSNVVYVDPSCGDGRILKALLINGANSVIGCDIDPVVAEVARMSLTETITTLGSSHNKMSVVVNDFLTTTKNVLHFASDFSSSKKDTTANSATPPPPPLRVRVVGSPPFSNCRLRDILSATRSSGHIVTEPADDEVEDYPLRFLAHCARELQAEKIVFLMPERCKRPEFIQKALLKMNTPALAVNSEEVNEVTSNKGVWKLNETLCGDGCFEFVGKNIKLPCVIQVWECKSNQSNG